jgi:hypothetical protein
MSSPFQRAGSIADPLPYFDTAATDGDGNNSL